MGRPYHRHDLMSTAFEMFSSGKGQKQIHVALSASTDSPGLKTVGNWISKFKAVSEEELWLDSLFRWSETEKIGLQWDCNPFISRLSKAMSKDGFSIGPTRRRVLWWWRVHQSRPDFSDEEILECANQCVLMEHVDLLGIGETNWASVETILSSEPEAVDSVSMMEAKVVRVEGYFAVCSFGSDEPFPEWVRGVEFLAVIVTPTEMSVICLEGVVPEDVVASRGWSCVRLSSKEIQTGLILQSIRNRVEALVISSGEVEHLLVKERRMTVLAELLMDSNCILVSETLLD